MIRTIFILLFVTSVFSLFVSAAPKAQVRIHPFQNHVRDNHLELLSGSADNELSSLDLESQPHLPSKP